ncbi:MAG: hypothetical protein ABIN61_05050 [candidate division WOR-3 bacterium]
MREETNYLKKKGCRVRRKREFFDIEVFEGKEHFFHKVNNYLFFFNTMRKNSNKNDKLFRDTY